MTMVKGIENEVEIESEVLSVFQGYEISLDEFKNILKNREGQSVVVELMSNQRIITAQWYDELEIDCSDKYISLNQTDEEKPDTNIWINDIEEILCGQGILEDHWLIKLYNGLEYFIHETV